VWFKVDVKKAIIKRKSIRNYSRKKVSDSLIKELIESARLAPSGGNVQSSKYFIISNEKIKNELRKNNVFVQDWVYSSPVIVLCLANPSEYKKTKYYNKKTISIIDLSIASSYMVLRATELGLGTCYIGWRDENKIKKILSIPKNYLLPFAITLGFPAEFPKRKLRKDVNKIIIGKC
jgi:nitroreductase